jgi:poly-beta-1,6-N-acetyl-D-glucosamine N-deacetylase
MNNGNPWHYADPAVDGVNMSTIGTAARAAPASIRTIAFSALRYSGMPFLIREVIQRRKVTFVLYHSPDPLTLDKHLSWLRARYNVVALSDFRNAMESEGRPKLPPKSLIITFDGGAMQNYELLPIFKKHGVVPVIFLCSGVVATNRHFWWTENRGKIDNESLKDMPDAERLAALRESGFEEKKEYGVRQALSAQEIDEMKPNVDFQSHTVFHPCLTRCTTARARDEIAGSKRALLEEHGIDVSVLSYPDGDYSRDVIRFATEAGYRYGITVDWGFNGRRTDPFKLKRIAMADHAGPSELIVRVSGVWGLLKKMMIFRSQKEPVG